MAFPAGSRFFGYAIEDGSFSTSRRIDHRIRVQVFTPTTSGLELTLPDARNLQLGGPYFFLVNEDTTNSIDIVDDGGTSQATLGTEEGATIWLRDNSDADGDWYIKVAALGSIPSAPVNRRLYALGGGSLNDIDCQEWDADTDVWTTKSSQSVTAGQDDGKIAFSLNAIGYVTAGNSGDDFFEYNPDVYTQKTDTDTNTRRSCGCSQQNDTQNDDVGFLFTDNSTLFINVYTRSTNNWADAGNLSGYESTRLQGAGTAGTGTNIHIFGGIEGTGGGINTTDIHLEWNTSLSGQVSKTNLPSPARFGASAARVNRDIYLCGGDDTAGGGTILSDVDVWNLDSETWSTGTALPTARRLGGCATIETVLVFCGGNNSGPQDDTYTWNGSSWATVSVMASNQSQLTNNFRALAP